MAQIKSLAKSGQKDACTLLAKQLVQLRNQKTKNINVGAQITSMASRGRSVYTERPRPTPESVTFRQMNSANNMAKAMGTTAQTMKAIDQQMPIHQFNATVCEFTQEQDKLDMRSEIMDDAFDNLFEVGEEEENAVIDQVLDEIGVETKVKVELLSVSAEWDPIISWVLQLTNIPRVADVLDTESLDEKRGEAKRYATKD